VVFTSQQKKRKKFMSTSIVLNSESFETAADAFRTRCSVPFLIILSEENIATQPAPPNLAFTVPQTSILSSMSKAILEGFRRYLAEPNNAPMFWLSRGTNGKDPVSWTVPVGLLAQEVEHEHDLEDLEKRLQREKEATTVTASTSSSSSPYSAASATSSLQMPKQEFNPDTFRKPRVLFPIKLYANFRVTKRGEIFPFHASNLNGPQLVDGLHKNALHALKRSVAIMNTDYYRDFLGKLNPQDMKLLFDFCMMDSTSIFKRAQLSRFHKDILGTINVRAWPVMIHSMESGRTLTLSIPAEVMMTMMNSNNIDKQQQQQQRTTGGAVVDSKEHSSSLSPVIVMGIQGQFIAHHRSKKKAEGGGGGDDDEEEEDVVSKNNKRPTTFGDVVKALANRMNPAHLDTEQRDTSIIISVLSQQQMHERDIKIEMLRRRMIVGGLPEAPLSETPLRWMMEHLVGSDMALHILLLPPQKSIALA
jgi:hypothetical protein